MTDFNAEKAHKEIVEKLNNLTAAIETLTIVNALDAGVPSSKLSKVLHVAQSRVSDFSKHIKERSTPGE